MTVTKRLGLGALLLVAVALFTSTPALAQSTITLENTADPTDSGASGQAALTEVAYSNTDSSVWRNSMTVADVYTAILSVECAGLTPGATYRIGPTGSEPVYNKKTKQTVWMPTYSYVQASGTGTVRLTAQLTFAGCVSTYVWVDWFGWYFTGTSYPDYSIVVDRKQGSKYKPVLQGSFLSPAAPPPQ